MRYASIKDRFLAYLIDYFMMMIPLFIGTSYIIVTYFREFIDAQEYPFILLILLIFPIYMYGYLFIYPSIAYLKIVVMSIIVIILLETVLLMLMELIGQGSTIGKNRYKIKVTMSDNTNYKIGRRICRALLKSITRNIIFIPYISILFTRRRQSVYDLVLRTIVIKNTGY